MRVAISDDEADKVVVFVLQHSIKFWENPPKGCESPDDPQLLAAARLLIKYYMMEP